MSIEYNLKIYPVSWLINQNKENKLNTDISIQRKEVWDLIFKSNLIASLLHGVSLNSLWFEKDEKGFKVIDGKQRLITLCHFIEDGFALSPKIHIKQIDGFPLAGKKFSAFPEHLKDRLLEYQLSITVYNPMTEEERDFVFFMGNQSAPLTKMDLSPVLLGETVTKEFDVLCSHPFFKEKVKLSPSHIRRRMDLKLILQFIILDSGKEIGFSGKELLSICDDIKHGYIKTRPENILAVLDYLNQGIPASRSYLKPLHLPVILYAAKLAGEKGIKAEEFCRMLDDFFMEIRYIKEQDSSKWAGVWKRIQRLSAFIDADGS